MAKQPVPDEFSFFKDKLIDSAAAPEKAEATPAPGAPPVAAARTRTASMDPALKDKIVLIDDSPTILTVTGGILKKAGFGAIPFRDATVALQELLSMSPEELGDIKAIICDHEMKKLSGLDLLKEVRTKAQLTPIPFIMLTGSTDRLVAQKAKALKVTAYLQKPVSTGLILNALNALFPTHEALQAELKRAK